MGGSGGSTGDYLSADDLELLREQAQQRFAQSRIESEVNSLLHHALASINDRDTERVNSYLEAIEQALGDRIDGVDRLLFGGSVAKQTYVDGLSDIDALVLLGDESLSERAPAEVRSEFAQALRQALPQGDVQGIHEGAMAVTVEYRDGTEIQLLPAIRTGDEIAVSSWDGESWSATLPRSFAQDLTEANQTQGNAVVPAIKLAKSIFASELGDPGLSGYHVETLAVAAFQEYSGPRTPKAMLTHLVDHASRDVLRPIQDITGQSRYVDESLGAENSATRQALSRNLARLARTMTNSQSIDDWEALLN